MTTEIAEGTQTNDDVLVGECLSGNRDAFRQIVERYQNLVASLAYSATGNVSMSEDIAQETFVTAWTQLAQLREPAKLRSWLCGIARFLISKEFRRRGHEPIHHAESMDSLDEWESPDPLPVDHVMSDEEKALLWLAIERVPEVYRETLVLYYREHQSVEAVARDLDLTEDAARQRLFRGRKLLQDQVLAFVAGALKQTTPGKTLTVAVMASLPLLGTSAKAATVTAAAGKGSSAGKAAGAMGTWGAFFLTGGGMLLLSLLGVFGFAGRWIGRRMGLASRQSWRGRQHIIQFWRTIAIGFWVLVIPPILTPVSALKAHPWLFAAGNKSIALFFWIVLAALLIWTWQDRRDSKQPAAAPELNPAKDSTYNLWVTLGILGPGCLVALLVYACLFSQASLSMKYIPEDQAQQMISQREDAHFEVQQNRDGSKNLVITLPEDRRIDRFTPFTSGLQAALKEKGIAYVTLVEDQDFHNGGFRGWIVVLSTLITAAGTVLLLRRPGTEMFLRQESMTPQAEFREKKIFGICAAGLLIVVGLLALSFLKAHPVNYISTAEARRMIETRPGAKYEVFEYHDGGKELWIITGGRATRLNYVAAADSEMTRYLQANKISYKTFVQGKDFGIRDPSRPLLRIVVVFLPLAAIWILWRVIKLKFRGRPEQQSTNSAFHA